MNNIENQLKVELLNVDKFIKTNNLKEITNPVFFKDNNVPNPDGLLSNSIFGITKTERAGTFAYIDLNEKFMNPLVYKIWCKMDSKIRDCIHGTKKFKIVKGELVEDPDGDNGIEFIRKYVLDIVPKNTTSLKRDRNVNFIETAKNNNVSFFIDKFPVIPAYYRDVNTNNGYVGVGEINQLYSKLLIAIRSLKESSDYGLSLSAATRGRVQEILLDIYNWFTQGPSDSSGTGLSAKMGIIHRDILSKTATRGSRLVISAPKLNVESMDDMLVDMDHSAIPLASICANFFPYIIFNLKRFFENEFGGDATCPLITKDNKVEQIKVKDYQIYFSDDRLTKEVNRFIHGYSNRFIPIEIPTYDIKKTYYMRFMGYNGTAEDLAKGNVEPNVPLINRRFTWCDAIFLAAYESIKDKMILITRFPIDSQYNQFPTKIVINSTVKTEPMIVNNQFIKNYPYIREEMIGTDTSNSFIDTANINNAYLKGIGGDYDGDQTTNKGVFTIEANEELEKYINSNAHYITLGARNIRTTTNEGLQSLYNLTLVLPDTKLTEPY